MLPVPASSTYEPSSFDDVEVTVGEAAQVVRRPEFVLLGRVVEHDVEPHLDVVFVGGGDQVGEFGGRCVAGRVLPVDRPEHERHVAPVVALVGVELVDRQQLDHADSERGEPRQFVDGGTEGPGVSRDGAAW